MGHINFTIAMDSDRKGIYGAVTLDKVPLKHWQMALLPLEDDWISGLPQAAPGGTKEPRPGGVYRGQFTLDKVADTFLDMSRWKKGVVWVNGHNLGRYWSSARNSGVGMPGRLVEARCEHGSVPDPEVNEPQPLDGKPERN